MRSSSCVYIEWRDLISDSLALRTKRDSLDASKRITLMLTFGSRESGNGQFDFPNSICVLGDRILVLDHCNHRVQVWDENGEFVSVFGSTGPLVYPSGICIFGDEVIVSDYGSKTIQVFNSTTLIPTRSINLGVVNPLGICSTPKGLLLVTTSQNHILMVNLDGYIIRKFGSYGKDNGQFNNPRGICCKGKIIVADRDNHRIQIFDQEGVFLHKFDQTQGGYTELSLWNLRRL